MKIRKVTVNNLGIYCGQHVFDFSQTSREKPIILFGGLNGAGKTTLFDGIRLCLYGKDMFKKISEKSYSGYLFEKIHRTDSMLLPPDSASITIDFEYAESGNVNNFRVERSWGVLNSECNDTEEQLVIYKNDILLDDVNEESWQDFINEMIPIGVSQLFFFDGEKIKNIIADNSNNEFANSVKTLLGIDIIERLQADLKIYRTRSLGKISSDKEHRRIEELESESATIEVKESQIRDKMGSIENHIQKIQSELKQYKHKFVAEGGAFFNQRDKLKQQKSDQERELELLREQLRETAAGALPVLIANTLALKLKTQLQAEEKQYIENLLSDKLNAKKIDFLKSINSSNNPLLHSLPAKTINKLSALMDSCFNFDSNKVQTKEIFGYSSSQINSLLAVINETSSVGQRLKQLVNNYEVAFRKLQKSERDLAKVPADDLIKTMYDRLASLSETLGQAIAEKTRLEEQLMETERRKSAISIENGHIYHKIADTKKNDLKIELTLKTDNALNIYKTRLVESRLDRLKHEFLKAFKELHRKDDIVGRIEIDPETLSISMIDKKNKDIPVAKLSSGEQEIYAIALLSSLAKTSGMSLPFIIDTPLGRLDNKHRHNLIHNFFPNISHQMIIFSTDTEIIEEYHKFLSPHIAHSYNLEYDDNNKHTQAKQGYFWK